MVYRNVVESWAAGLLRDVRSFCGLGGEQPPAAVPSYVAPRGFISLFITSELLLSSAGKVDPVRISCRSNFHRSLACSVCRGVPALLGSPAASMASALALGQLAFQTLPLSEWMWCCFFQRAGCDFPKLQQVMGSQK